MALRASSNICNHLVWLLITWPPHFIMHMKILLSNMHVCVCLCVREREGKREGEEAERERFPELNVEFLRTKIAYYFLFFLLCQNISSCIYLEHIFQVGECMDGYMNSYQSLCLGTH